MEQHHDPSQKTDPILIVDDEEVVTTSVRDLLEGEGYPVMTARSGEEALDIVGQTPVQMILTDIQMPGISGLQLQKRLKNICPLTPVLIMTAFPTVERAVAALHAGAVNFITKPFDIQVVLDTVQRTIQSQHQMQQNIATESLATTEHDFHIPGTLEHVRGLLYYFAERTLMKDVYFATVLFQIRLALDEILVNCVKHGTHHNPDKHIRVRATISRDTFEAIIEDEGDGFDLATVPPPDADVNLWELSEGGRGIFLVRCYMDSVEYTQSGRCVRIVKHNREDAD